MVAVVVPLLLHQRLTNRSDTRNRAARASPSRSPHPPDGLKTQIRNLDEASTTERMIDGMAAAMANRAERIDRITPGPESSEAIQHHDHQQNRDAIPTARRFGLPEVMTSSSASVQRVHPRGLRSSEPPAKTSRPLGGSVNTGPPPLHRSAAIPGWPTPPSRSLRPRQGQRGLQLPPPLPRSEGVAAAVAGQQPAHIQIQQLLHRAQLLLPVPPAVLA